MRSSQATRPIPSPAKEISMTPSSDNPLFRCSPSGHTIPRFHQAAEHHTVITACNVGVKLPLRAFAPEKSDIRLYRKSPECVSSELRHKDKKHRNHFAQARIDPHRH
jgi:hypothetical protein